MIKDTIEREKQILLGKSAAFRNQAITGLFPSGKKKSLVPSILFISTSVLIFYLIIRKITHERSQGPDKVEIPDHPVSLSMSSVGFPDDKSAFVEFREKMILIALELARQVVIRLIRGLGEKQRHEGV
jgi:hypothetical protein